MSKSAWGSIGAWAEESERAEAEEREAASTKTDASSPGFPSLKESVTNAKQKKKTKMTLQEFTMHHHHTTTTGAASTARNRLTAEEMLNLPTGPKQRTADEVRSGRLGGGFSNYGSRIGSTRPREFEARRSYGYEEDERKGMPSISRASDFVQPSRADEVDNWASMKKPIVFERGRPELRYTGTYNSLSGSGGGGSGGPSRADEVDNWASLKGAPTLQTNQQDKFSSSLWSGSSSTETNRWVRNSQSIGSVSRIEQNLATDASKNESEVVEKAIKPNPFGAARPREDVLAEKGLDWKRLDMEIDEKNKKPQSFVTGRPMSSQSSRPESSHSSIAIGSFPSTTVTDAIEKPKAKVNPFGDAKPREVLLEEKGLDWRKIDLEFEGPRIDRTKTDEEKKLMEDIRNLRTELLEKSGEEKASLNDRLVQKEVDLAELVRRLDDQVHYSQKTFDRPGSGSSRSSGYPERPPSAPGGHEGPRGGSYSERPPSQSGAYDGRHERPHSRSGSTSSFTGEPSNLNDNDRARSYGPWKSWGKPNDTRRSSQGGARRGFSGNRDINRSGPSW